jgi:hypothetical protein
METTTLNASCLCGNVNFQVTLLTSSLPLEAHMCHCSICRRTHGTLCTFHARILKPSNLDGMTSYKVSADAEGSRYFCTNCGTQMCDGSDGDDKMWCISTGVVDKSDEVFEFKHHIFVTSTKDGGFSDFVPRINDRVLKCWEGHQEDSLELGADWKSSTRKETTSTSDGRLHAHCHCGGVSFYLHRPAYDGPAFEVDFPGVPLPGPEPRDRAKEFEQGNWWIATDRSKFSTGNCVCRSCRLGAGSDAVQWSFVPTLAISLADGSHFSPVFGTLKEYNSSDAKWRRFCGTCGAAIFWHDVNDRPKMIDVAVGILDAESGARAEDWLEWRTAKLSGQDSALNQSLAEALKDGARRWALEKEKA